MTSSTLLKERLPTLLRVEAANYWEIEDHIEQLAEQPAEVQQEILRQVEAIWPVSQALCFIFLDQVPKALQCLHHSQLSAWVNATLDVYEKDGLQQAHRFMAEVEANFLCQIRGEAGISLVEASGRLLPYLRGLAGFELELAAATEVYTDGKTIFLPPEITLFREKSLNFLTYKLLASCQWALLAGGTFDLRLDPEQPPLSELSEPVAEMLKHHRQSWPVQPFPANFWNLFPQPELAADLFTLLETRRLLARLRDELPGLMRDSAVVLAQLHRQRPEAAMQRDKNRLLEALSQWLLQGQIKGDWPAAEQERLSRALELLDGESTPPESATPATTLNQTSALYQFLAQLPGEYRPEDYQPLLGGRLRPAAVAASRQQQREEQRQRFIKALGLVLPPTADGQEESPEATTRQAPSPPTSEHAALMPPPPGPPPESPEAEQPGTRQPEYITLGEQEIKLPEELRELAREIRDDLGRIPEHYISAALEQAGGGMATGAGPDAAAEEQAPPAGALVYDEWDYRRAGFRKNWCTLVEKKLPPVRSRFIEQTMAKYQGPWRLLKRQFEMMRLSQRFLRRQRDGDEIDLDAAIEAFSDLRAGQAASDKLFIRLTRDQRDIATFFLVDMSYSTEGWINTAIKETLVLICEALRVLGDRHAIYGFSGMRRSRSELYHIKHLDEDYDQAVQDRISGITPQDYTRMGPPIRHLTRMLSDTDARIRLLIIISDGKPEDYDDYKGDYAIEDTRHALIEAKNAGIHPFCITIDRQAHDYIPHLFGAVNYIFIDQVKRLPLRMPEIYRALTT
ncbi:MAG: VWA domain-containing protein [Desulfurivibrio sp.]|nr:VWA domain-containing protein [Desulfurivibrio sp.]